MSVVITELGSEDSEGGDVGEEDEGTGLEGSHQGSEESGQEGRGEGALSDEEQAEDGSVDASLEASQEDPEEEEEEEEEIEEEEVPAILTLVRLVTHQTSPLTFSRDLVIQPPVSSQSLLVSCTHTVSMS